ncbi:MAG TPA: amino acid adenylation domain-containing protein, partial [Ktedonobacteraceae bacterium]|nr:amino acid adenylation domain-containing protein [Ktedonobacteraceae bacterium]
EIFVRELTLLYSAFAAHSHLPLTPLPIQYADFALWQRGWLLGEVLERQLEYWQKQLTGIVPLELPTDCPRPPMQTYRGARKFLLLSPDLQERLQALSQQTDVTLFMTLLAAFQVLLARYSGQRDISVGTPIAHRTRDEVKGLIGFFVNTLVMRSDLSANLPFIELLKNVRAIALEAYAHQDIPFEQLVDKLQPVRDMARSPLFQVMFSFQHAPERAEQVEGLKLRSLGAEVITTKFDLTLNAVSTSAGLSCRVEYNSDLFAPETMERFLQCWLVLLEGIAARPDTLIYELPLLSEEERHMQLVTWNETRIAYQNERALHELFVEQAACTPDAIVLVAEDEYLSYAYLDRCTNQLACYLRAMGVSNESIIGIALERSLFLSIALLAVLKAGGAYLPLELAYPEERLRYMLAQSQASLLLTVNTFAEQARQISAGESACPILYLDRQWPQIMQQPERALSVRVMPEQVAYVIYTSGSTGHPKGVMNTHYGICNRLLWMQQMYRLEARDRVMQKTPISFDVSVWELFWPLLTGACLVMARPGGERESTYLVELMQQQGITLLHFVPSLLQVFLEEERVACCESVRQVICSGEVLSLALQDLYYQRMPGRLDNLYGPTEAAVDVTWWACRVDPGQRNMPIGRPINNIHLYVLDSWMQPVPVGTPGELYIGGVGVARGYAQRPDLTAERFVPHPYLDLHAFSPEEQPRWARLYRTGDQVRYRIDGTVEYLGRLDQQVKLHGLRIELGEIEKTVLQHPSIAECAVCIRQVAARMHLVAYFIAAMPGEECSSETVRAYVREKLPEYMLPSFFIQLEHFPLLPNGKLDRQGFPEPVIEHEPASRSTAPRTQPECILAEIWSQVLGVQEIGIYDNFFALGGDSIQCIQVVSRARRAGLRLTPRQLFQHQTIAQLAQVAEAHDLPIEDRTPVTGPVALTPIQHWLLGQSLPEFHYFNQSRLLEVPAQIAFSALQQAFAAVIEHHDVLRLRLDHTAEGWKLVNTPWGIDRPLSIIDLSPFDGREQQRVMETLALEAQASLNPEAGRMLCGSLFVRGVQKPAYLLVIIHHLVIDAVSWQILLEDLEIALDSLQQGQAMRLPSKTTSFQQWAQRLQEYAQTPQLLEELPYWQAPERQDVQALPLDFPEGQNTEASSATINVVLDARQTRLLIHEALAVYHAQMNEVLLAALAHALASWTSQRLFLVDLEGHGREEIFADIDLTRTVGWFTTLFPVLLQSAQDMTLEDTLRIVKEQLRQIPQRGLGYGLLRYLCPDPGVRESLATLPLAQISFNYLGQEQRSPHQSTALRRVSGFTGSPISQSGGRSHLLIINGGVTDGQLHFSWQYSQELLTAQSMQYLADRFVEALQELIAHCQLHGRGSYTPSDFPLAGLDQRQLEKVIQFSLRDQAEREVADIYPLTPMQEGLLFHVLYMPEADFYHEQYAWTIQGAVQSEAWRRAWQYVVDRHPILRTGFLWQGVERPLQVVSRHVAVPWEFHDWRHGSPPEHQIWLETLCREERQRGFQLEYPPLMRLVLIQIAEESFIFLLNQHHLLLDGWSQPLVFKEVLVCYQAFCRGEDPVLPLPRPYRDYVDWLQQQRVVEAEQFWRKTLEGFTTPTKLMVERAARQKRNVVDYEMAEALFTLSPEKTAALHQLAQHHRLTLNTLLQGAWALLLACYSGEQDILFGSIVAGRPPELAGVESMIGLFINTLPVRVRINSEMRLMDWLAHLQEQQVEARQYGYVPLVQVQRWSSVSAEQPLFETLFLFQNLPVESIEEEHREQLIIQARYVHERTHYPLWLKVVARRVLTIQLVYDETRFDALTIGRLQEYLRMLLEAMLAQMQQRLCDLPRLTVADRETIMRSWNSHQAEREPGVFAHQFFERQVNCGPDVIAAACDEQYLTYERLNQQANALAHLIASQGVAPEVPVAVLLDRGLSFLWTMLAIWKAGGVYLPLDPLYPVSRITQMLRQHRCPLVLTSEAYSPALTQAVAELPQD